MSEPSTGSSQLPLTIFGRSPFDGIRLRWCAIGNMVLALYCFFGSRGGIGGILFGLLFVFLIVTTWSVTHVGTTDWRTVPPSGWRVVAGIGAVTGFVFTYLFFAVFFMTIWFIMLIADWMS